MPSPHTHDEITYDWSPDMGEVVWALATDGVVHLWYKIRRGGGFSGCGVLRKDLQRLSVTEMNVTCLSCLAVKGDVFDGAFEILKQQLVESLGIPGMYLGLTPPVKDSNDK